MARPGVSGSPTGFITGSAIFTREQAEDIKESANRNNGNTNHSLRTAIQSLCLEAVDIHTVLTTEEITKIKELGGSDSLCESLAIICKKVLINGVP